jgi:hypothetical protein
LNSISIPAHLSLVIFINVVFVALETNGIITPLMVVPKGDVRKPVTFLVPSWRISEDTTSRTTFPVKDHRNEKAKWGYPSGETTSSRRLMLQRNNLLDKWSFHQSEFY